MTQLSAERESERRAAEARTALEQLAAALNQPRADAPAATSQSMKGWRSDADGGLWTVDWRGLQLRVEIAADGWKASCGFVHGPPAGMEEAASGLGTWPDRTAAADACRRHARRAKLGKYRRRGE